MAPCFSVYSLNTQQQELGQGDHSFLGLVRQSRVRSNAGNIAQRSCGDGENKEREDTRKEWKEV